jgi:hypothetical protein
MGGVSDGAMVPVVDPLDTSGGDGHARFTGVLRVEGGGFASVRASLGRAVQVNTIKPTFKPPGTKRLKLQRDNPLSNFAFNFNLRLYSSAAASTSARSKAGTGSSLSVDRARSPLFEMLSYDVASTAPVQYAFVTWRAPVRYASCEVASTGTRCIP